MGGSQSNILNLQECSIYIPYLTQLYSKRENSYADKVAFHSFFWLN